MYTSVHVQAPVYAWFVCKDVHEYGSQRTTSDVIPQALSTLCFETSLSLMWASQLDEAGWLASSKDLPVSTFPTFSYIDSVIEPRALFLKGKDFTHFTTHPALMMFSHDHQHSFCFTDFRRQQQL